MQTQTTSKVTQAEQKHQVAVTAYQAFVAQYGGWGSPLEGAKLYQEMTRTRLALELAQA